MHKINQFDGIRRCNWITSSALLAATLVVAGCGGGGGGSTPTPVSVTQTVTCPNGASKTGTGVTTTAATDAANAQCAAPALVSISPTNGNSAVSADTFTSIDVTTDSTLDATSITSANVTLTTGTSAVAGAASAVGTKGFKFVSTAKLAYGKAYVFAASVKDTLGKVLTVNSTFTTAALTCTSPQVLNVSGTACEAPVCPSPQVWTTGINACAYPMGVKVVGTNKLPAGCLDVHDQCWRDSVANGTVKWILTSAVTTGVDTRPVAFAYFFNAATPSPTNGNYNVDLFYADTGLPMSSRISNGNIDQIDWVYGTPKGLIMHITGSTTYQGPLVHNGEVCGEFSWYPPTTQTGVNSNIWITVPIECPPL